MTRDDIIRMAKEVGGVEHYAGLADKVCWAFEESELEAFAALVAAEEREACAKACEHFLSSKENDDAWTITRDLAFQAAANVIRARGKDEMS